MRPATALPLRPGGQGCDHREHKMNRVRRRAGIGGKKGRIPGQGLIQQIDPFLQILHVNRAKAGV